MKKLQKSTNETYLMLESHEAETEEEISVPANATVKGDLAYVIRIITFQWHTHMQMAGGRFYILKKKALFLARKCRNMKFSQELIL